LLGSYPQLIHKNPVFQGYPYLDDPVFREKSKGIPASLEYIARRAREEPARYLQWYGIGKTRMFLSWPILVGQRDGPFLYPVTSTMYQTNSFFRLSLVASNVLHNVLCVLTVGGLLLLPFVARSKKRSRLDPAVAVSGLFVVYFVLIHVILSPLPRYAMPIHGFLYLCGSVVLYELGRLGTRKLGGNEPA
jgi:hypothetical protein